MAYYAAVVSLRKTIQHLLDPSQIWIHPSSREILKFAYQVVRTVHEVLHENEESIRSNWSNERLKPLNEKIRAAACKLEDVLETHVSNQIQSLGDGGSSLTVSPDLVEVKKGINSFVMTMRKTEEMMMEELRKPLPKKDFVDPSINDSGGNNSKMVGLSEEFSQLKDLLMNLSPGLYTVPIWGMAGIGKTFLARKIFEDPSISRHFDPCVFVTIGQKIQFKKLMLDILPQIKHGIGETCTEGGEGLAEYIRESLQGRRYFIVLDDVWEKKDVIKVLKRLLPQESNRSRVLVTTRREAVAEDVAHKKHIHHMRFLNKEESWDLLREKVFGEGRSCPYKLENFGKKIAENCEGLPLMIVTVANILSKEDKTLDYWEKAAEQKNSLFTDAYNQMSEVLILSYNALSQILKPLFLYMGVFPQTCKIPASNLLKLWHVERFFDDFSNGDLPFLAKLGLRGLVSSSIVLDDQRSSIFQDQIKTCRLHSAYWHLCIKEADKENFLHVMNRHDSNFVEGIKNQRRLCIHNNVLFGIRDVYDSMKSIQMVHSLLCTGPYHRYPVPIFFGLRLLRVLDALTIRFYKFPIEVLELVLLRYLALTYNGKVPGSISKLWNLEHLIIHRLVSINKPSQDSTYLPMEIWNMEALRHIQVNGGNLRDPCCAVLQNLLTLSGMSVNSCSKNILERTPNLKKLGIQIELTPDAIEPLSCFDHFSHLHYLESLKCVIVNPKPMSHRVGFITTLPSHLKKLSLSGLGYPWKYMRMIAKLPELRVLKLRCYAFQGPVWETYDWKFPKLEYLLLEDTNLELWRANGSYSFPSLQRLIVGHCYKLKEIPLFGCEHKLEFINLVDCPSLWTSVEQLKREYPVTKIHVQSSLDEKKK